MWVREIDCNAPGIARAGAGRGFFYRDPTGRRIDDPEVVGRIRALAIPPAWTDVWICSDPKGHIQATGIDARRRRQYLYHEGWHVERSLGEEAFDRCQRPRPEHHLPAQQRLLVKESGHHVVQGHVLVPSASSTSAKSAARTSAATPLPYSPIWMSTSAALALPVRRGIAQVWGSASLS